MPNTSVFISLMFPALYRRVCKNSKKKFCKKEFECTKCKATFKFFFSTFLAFLCIFAGNDTLHFAHLVISLASGTSAASMTSTASTTSVVSMTSTASFHQKTYWAWCFLQSCTKLTYSGLSMWDNSAKIPYFIDFWHSFCWRLWRPWMLVLTKSKDLKSNVPCQWIHRQFVYEWKFNFRCPSKALVSRISLWNTLYVQTTVY